MLRLKIAFLALLIFSITTVSDAGVCDDLFGFLRTEVSNSLYPRVDKMLAPGKYEILDKIGEGGLSEVFRVREIVSNKIFVLKVLNEVQSNERKSLTVLANNEMKILQLLSRDENAPVPAYVSVSRDGAKDKTTAVFGMEELRGYELFTLLEKFHSPNKPMPAKAVARVLALLSKSLRAVDYLHKKHNLLHNDLKGENFWVTPDGEVKLLDFGLSDFKNKKPYYIENNNLAGTLGFVPPEGWRFEAYDNRSDIFSMGVLLENTFSRLKIPTKEWGRTPADITIIDTSGNNYELPDKLRGELQKIYKKATQLDPKDRYQSAQDMANDVESLAKEIYLQLIPKAGAIWIYHKFPLANNVALINNFFVL
jgi:serine/threonine-protein kinase